MHLAIQHCQHPMVDLLDAASVCDVKNTNFKIIFYIHNCTSLSRSSVQRIGTRTRPRSRSSENGTTLPRPHHRDSSLHRLQGAVSLTSPAHPIA
uniref:Uncharacterized protein n=1 Tax=Parascaris univalens TaxID=6257 RepID=A0A915A7G4_PARUN